MWPAILLLIAPIADWPTWKPEGAGYTVRMPTGAATKTEPASERPEKVDVHSLTADEAGLKFAVYSYVISSPIAAARRSPLLDSIRNGLTRSNRGSIRSESKIAIEGHPARDLVLDVPIDAGGAAILRARLILVDRRIFQLYAWAPETKAGRPEIAEFLDSFRLDSGRPAPFSPSSAGFSARFPGVGTVERKDRIGDREWTAFEARDAGISFVVAHVDLDEAAIKDPKRVLDLARDEQLASSSGRLTAERKITASRNPGREIAAEIPEGDDPAGGLLSARLILDRRRLYAVRVFGPKSKGDPAITRAFLDSFRPGPPR